MEKFDSTDSHTLDYTDVERDLGIMISQSLNMEHHYLPAPGIRSTGMIPLSQEGHPNNTL